MNIILQAYIHVCDPTSYKSNLSHKTEGNLGLMESEKRDLIEIAADKYRSFLHDESKNTEWRHGGPPIYDVVNKLFEEGRTKVCLHLSFRSLLYDTIS